MISDSDGIDDPCDDISLIPNQLSDWIRYINNSTNKDK